MKLMSIPLPTGDTARTYLPDTATAQDLRTLSAVLNILAEWWETRQSLKQDIPALPAIQDLLPN